MVKEVKKPYSKCIELAKKIAKSRDGYKCVKCPRSKKNGYQIHGSHIIGVGAEPRMAVMPRNIKALCATHHIWWHSDPTESGEWFKTTFPDWHKELKKIRLELNTTLQKPNYQKMYLELKETYDKGGKNE